MSSPLKAPLFSDAIGSSSGSSGHRKRTYLASLDNPSLSSPNKRFRSSPTAHKSFSTGGSWRDSHQLTRSSPLKRRQPHFTTSTGPDVSFYQHQHSRRMADLLTSAPDFTASDDDDDLGGPTHSFAASNMRSSPPSTPPMRTRGLPGRKNKDKTGAAANGANGGGAKTGEDPGADLLLYLAASPSPESSPDRKSTRLNSSH